MQAIDFAAIFGMADGVADGARTHDNRNHNPGLYQLSYSHRRELNYRPRLLQRPAAEAASEVIDAPSTIWAL